MRCSDIIVLASMTRGGGWRLRAPFWQKIFSYVKRWYFFFSMTYDFIIVYSTVPHGIAA
jgi:hypothetical protein